MYAISILLFAPLFVVIYNYWPNTTLERRLVEILFSSWYFWAVLLLVVGISYLPVKMLLNMSELCFPNLKEVIL